MELSIQPADDLQRTALRNALARGDSLRGQAKALAEQVRDLAGEAQSVVLETARLIARAQGVEVGEGVEVGVRFAADGGEPEIVVRQADPGPAPAADPAVHVDPPMRRRCGKQTDETIGGREFGRCGRLLGHEGACSFHVADLEAGAGGTRAEPAVVFRKPAACGPSEVLMTEAQLDELLPSSCAEHASEQVEVATLALADGYFKGDVTLERIGAALRALRERKGLSVEELCAAVGSGRVYPWEVESIELGKLGQHLADLAIPGLLAALDAAPEPAPA